MNIKEEYKKALRKLAAKDKDDDVLSGMEMPEPPPVSERNPLSGMELPEPPPVPTKERDPLSGMEVPDLSFTPEEKDPLSGMNIENEGDEEGEEENHLPSTILPRPNTSEELEEARQFYRSMDLDVDRKMRIFEIVKEVEKHDKKSNRSAAETAIKREEELDGFKRSGIFDDIMEGMQDIIGTDPENIENEKAETEKFIKNQSQNWTVMSQDEKTSERLIEFISLYFQLEYLGGFTGEHFDFELIAPDEMDLSSFDKLKDIRDNLFSPEGFFTVLSLLKTEEIKSKESNEMVSVTPQDMFSRYIYTMTQQSNSLKDYNPDQLRLMRDKRQSTTSKLGGLIEKKIKEILLKLQRYVDNKFTEEISNIVDSQGIKLIPYFEFTEHEQINKEGITVAKLATINKGVNYINDLLKTSGGYIKTIILNSIFNKDKFELQIEDSLEEEKEESQKTEQEERVFASITPEEAKDKLDKLMLSSKTTFSTEDEIGNFLVKLYGVTSNPGLNPKKDLTKEQRMQGVEYETSDGPAQIISKPGSNEMLIITNIIDENSKSNFETISTPFDKLSVKFLTQGIKKYAGQPQEEEFTEAAEMLLNKLFTHVKVFKIDNENVTDISDSVEKMIKKYQKIPNKLELLFGNFTKPSLVKIKNIIKEIQETRKEVNGKTKEKTPAEILDPMKEETKETKETLKIKAAKIYEENTDATLVEKIKEFYDYLETIINKLHPPSKEKSEDDKETLNPRAAINIGRIEAARGRLNAGKSVSLNQTNNGIINLLDIPES